MMGHNSMVRLVLVVLLSAAATSALPRGFTTYFQGGSCPAGWVEQSTAWGRLVVSVNDSRLAGVTVNAPLTNMEQRSHTHTFKSQPFNIDEVKYCTTKGLGGDVVAQGSYTIDGGVASASAGLPLIQFRLCTLQAASLEAVPTATVAHFFDVTECPTDSGWMPYNAANGRAIIIGTPEDPQPNATWVKPLSSGENRNHTHTFSTVLQTDAVGLISTVQGCGYGMGIHQAYPIKGDTSSSAENIPYVQALTCQLQKNGSTSATVNAAAMFFTEGACPAGWKTQATFSGRFPVGLQPGGTASLPFGGSPVLDQSGYKKHTHSATADFQTRTHRISAWINVADHNNVAEHREYKWGFTTDASSDPASEFPWLSLKMCTH